METHNRVGGESGVMTDDRHDSGDVEDGIAETPIDAGIVGSVAADADVSREHIADGLVVVNASLLGEHSTHERESEYVTHEGVRAYVVDRAAWADLPDDHEFDPALADALRRVHTRQAERLFERAGANLDIDASDGDGEDAGIVIGIDTAEDMR